MNAHEALKNKDCRYFFEVNTTYLEKKTKKRGDKARAASSHSTQSTNPLHERMRSGMQVDPPSRGENMHSSVIPLQRYRIVQRSFSHQVGPLKCRPSDPRAEVQLTTDEHAAQTGAVAFFVASLSPQRVCIKKHR
jgi:hypothetical protein